MQKLRFFLLLYGVAHTEGLSIGIIVTPDEKTESLVSAFQMYKDMLPEHAFYNSGKKGPVPWLASKAI